MNILRWRIYVKIIGSGDYEDCGLLFASYEDAQTHGKAHFDHLDYYIVMTEVNK